MTETKTSTKIGLDTLLQEPNESVYISTSSDSETDNPTKRDTVTKKRKISLEDLSKISNQQVEDYISEVNKPQVTHTSEDRQNIKKYIDELNERENIPKLPAPRVTATSKDFQKINNPNKEIKDLVSKIAPNIPMGEAVPVSKFWSQSKRSEDNTQPKTVPFDDLTTEMNNPSGDVEAVLSDAKQVKPIENAIADTDSSKNGKTDHIQEGSLNSTKDKMSLNDLLELDSNNGNIPQKEEEEIKQTITEKKIKPIPIKPRQEKLRSLNTSNETIAQMELTVRKIRELDYPRTIGATELLPFVPEVLYEDRFITLGDQTEISMQQLFEEKPEFWHNEVPFTFYIGYDQDQGYFISSIVAIEEEMGTDSKTISEVEQIENGAINGHSHVIGTRDPDTKYRGWIDYMDYHNFVDYQDWTDPATNRTLHGIKMLGLVSTFQKGFLFNKEKGVEIDFFIFDAKKVEFNSEGNVKAPGGVSKLQPTIRIDFSKEKTAQLTNPV